MSSRTLKFLLLGLMLLLCLTLTACYIPSDEITDDGTGDFSGGGTINFRTVPPSASPTPTVAPATATPTSTNWDGWETTVTPDLFSVTTQPVRTIPVITLAPSATPRPTATASSLKKGASGSSVRTVQQRLKTLGYYTGTVDGEYGAGTEAAVRAFQKANGLTVDGKVGSKTLAKLNSSTAIATKKTTATPKPTAKRTPTPTPKRTATPKPTAKVTATPRKTATPRPTATPKLNTYLKNGSSGSAVKKLQERLISLGYLSGKADSKFGAATELAVRAFQKEAGIWQDGVAGPTTLTKLYSSSAPKASSASASIGESLKSGSEGSGVRALQKQLKALGYYTGSVDGSYGLETETAVMRFQRAAGLKADGIAGTETLAKLYSTSATAAPTRTPARTNAPSAPTATPVIASTGYITLREGSSGDAVRDLQTKLKSLGYYSGSVDGTYGSATVTAVRNFQSATNLRVDGIAGPATQRKLYSTTSGTTDYATIRPGTSGSAVANLQYTLYELGYYDGSVDGIYGSTTSDAVRAFQIRNSITPVDGIAGPKTLSVLYSSSAIADLEPTSTFSSLTIGSAGEDVLELKDALIQLGYLSSSDNNLYDDATAAAVRNFQSKNGLTVTGVANAETQRVLYSANPIANN
ncbi:MAG: peptidoglycan-binding protein [Clostridia bacterium]|nr:peptidoglycan-binding protein [Clostridia bacterium]